MHTKIPQIKHLRIQNLKKSCFLRKPFIRCESFGKVVKGESVFVWRDVALFSDLYDMCPSH